MEEQHTTTIQENRLARLYAVPDDKMFTVGARRYLGTAVVSEILTRAKQTVSKWCKLKQVFQGVKQSPEEYNGGYLIPFDEVERVIRENALPQPGNPNWILAGRNNPNPYPKKGTLERKKRVANGSKTKGKSTQAAPAR